MKRNIAAILLATMLAICGTGCTPETDLSVSASTDSRSDSQDGNMSESLPTMPDGTGETPSGTPKPSEDPEKQDGEGSDKENIHKEDTNTEDTNKEDTNKENPDGKTDGQNTGKENTGNENKKDETRINVYIPKKEGMKAEYTSAEGIPLEAGANIAVVVKDISTGYWKAVRTGARQAIDELNAALQYSGADKITMTFEGTSGEDEVESQINMIDTVLYENPVSLCLSVIDTESCWAQLEAAEQNGIPVIIADSGITGNMVKTTCGIDNRAAGALAAKKLCEAIGDAGQVLIVAHQSKTQTSIERVEGFEEELRQKHPDVSVVQTVYSDGEQPLAEAIEEALVQYPELKGVFGTNQQVSDKAAELLSGKKYEERALRMVGFDYSEIQKKAMEKGLLCGFVSQNPYSLGYAMIISAARAAVGMENDEMIDVGYQWIDKENIASDELALYRY